MSQAAVEVETTFGVLGVESSEVGVRRVHLGHGARIRSGSGQATKNAERAVAQLAEYVRGEREKLDLELDWTAVGPQHRHVLETLREVAPFGVTVTYGELGQHAGVDDPRDVGVFMATNPLPLVVPCHRVVASDGLGGYGGGLELKRRLLELEGVLPPRLDLGEL